MAPGCACRFSLAESALPISSKRSAFPDVETAGRIHAGEALGASTGDRDAATSSSPAICAGRQIAMGYRGYGLPISEVISEGNVGLMQAVKRFEPEKASPRHLRHVVDQGGDPGIHLALVVAGEDGHHREPEEAVLQLRRPRARSRAEEGDLRPEGAADRQAPRRHRAGRGRHERRLGGDVSLNAPIREDGDSGEWQDWLVDDVNADQETRLAESEESDNRRKALGEALSVLNERRAAHLRGAAAGRRSRHARGLAASSACRASACARSRCAPSRRCSGR